MEKKLFFLCLLFLGSNIIAIAQKANIIGKWNEQNTSGFSRTWVFNADGTKAGIYTMPMTYPIGGINCSFDIYQERIEEKWQLDDNKILTEVIPLQIKVDIKNLKQSGFTQAQKTKIKNAIPGFKQEAMKQAKDDWAKTMVGKRITYTINKLTQFRMVLDSSYGESFLLLRDTTSMTPAEKKAYHAELEQFKAEEHKAEEARIKDAEAKKIYEVVEENAQFPGGDTECNKWLSEHIQYPASAQEQGIQGRVILEFVVETDGSLSDIKVNRSPDPSLSQEAVRIVKMMPKWKPAHQNDKAVRSRFTLPIMFRL